MRRLSVLAAIGLALGAGIAGCASPPPVVVTQPIAVRSAPEGARVSLWAKRADLPTRFRGVVGYYHSTRLVDARDRARALPDEKWQHVGHTAFEYPLPVAVDDDGVRYEIYEEVRVRVEADGHEAFEMRLGVVGTDPTRPVAVDAALVREPEGYPKIARTLIVETDPPGAEIALVVEHRDTAPFRFERLPPGTAQVIGTSPVAGFDLITKRTVQRDGKATGIFYLYGDVRLVASAPGYERVEMPLAIYGATDETPLRVKLQLEPEPLRAHLGAVLKDTGAGVHVFSVEPEGPADKVGLRPGDYLLSVDGGSVKSVAEVREVLRGRRPGSPLKLGIRRRTEQDLEVTPVLGAETPKVAR